MQLTLSQMWAETDPGAEGVSWLSVTEGQVLQKCAAEDIVEEGAERTEVGGSFLISGLMKHSGYGRALWCLVSAEGALLWQEETRCELVWLIPRA